MLYSLLYTAHASGSDRDMNWDVEYLEYYEAWAYLRLILSKMGDVDEVGFFFNFDFVL